MFMIKKFSKKIVINHPKQRESIKILGVKKARENHTFKHRIINYMGELKIIKGSVS